jgi:hypothetical protein
VKEEERKMAILLIGTMERQKIADVIAYAKAHPVLFSDMRGGIVADTPMLKLKDRKPGYERPPSQHVIFPGGFRAAFSIEQQPPGLCTHLSVSVLGRAKRGAMPSPDAVKMIAEEFGVPYPADKMWLEEFDPGEFAVNLVSLYAPTQEGHA